MKIFKAFINTFNRSRNKNINFIFSAFYCRVAPKMFFYYNNFIHRFFFGRLRVTKPTPLLNQDPHSKV